MLKLNLQISLRKTSTVLQLADHSTATPEGIVEDVLVSVDSWEYPADFVVLQPKAKLTGYPLILGRPWLATVDAYISCRAGSMTIKNGPMSKQLVLYPPAQPLLEHDLPLWLEEGYEDEVYSAPLCTVEATRGGPQTEDDLTENLIQNPPPGALSLEELVEHTQASALVDLCVTDLTTPRVKNVEFGPERTLKINSSLSPSQEKELCSLLNRHLEAFAWRYKEMKGIHPSEELQKFLDAGFIYPISDSEWVSPLVLVPKKNGKWRICVDYKELNKATKKYHFPLSFIDQVLDGLAGKKFFSFLDGFSGYNQIQISSEDQDKTTFTCPWGTFAYRVLPFGLCNAPTTFQRAVLSIFAELVHDLVEIYMDDFTPYGSSFQEALSNLEKVLSKCIEMNLSLNPEKCEFLMTEGTVLGHTISRQGLQVDTNKISIIKKVPPPQKQFDLTIVDKPGKENVVVDFLSRLDFPVGEEGTVDDQMPDEHLFSISVLSPWFADIANYLVSA
eukprot:PITA_08680